MEVDRNLLAEAYERITTALQALETLPDELQKTVALISTDRVRFLVGRMLGRDEPSVRRRATTALGPHIESAAENAAAPYDDELTAVVDPDAINTRVMRRSQRLEA